MTESWTPKNVAQALFEILPMLGRLMFVRMREEGQEDTTIMQIGVLMRLKDHPITTSELAKRRKVSLQAASTLVQNLVDRGWITRVPDPNDRRQFLLQVTPEGAARAQAMQEQTINFMTEPLNALTQEEIDAAEVFLTALRRLTTANIPSEDDLSDPPHP